MADRISKLRLSQAPDGSEEIALLIKGKQCSYAYVSRDVFPQLAQMTFHEVYSYDMRERGRVILWPRLGVRVEVSTLLMPTRWQRLRMRLRMAAGLSAHPNI